MATLTLDSTLFPGLVKAHFFLFLCPESPFISTSLHGAISYWPRSLSHPYINEQIPNTITSPLKMEGAYSCEKLVINL
jgi:hypothetical protein